MEQAIVCNKQFLKETFRPALENHLAIFPNSTAGFKTNNFSDKHLHVVTAIFNKELHGCTIHNDPFHTMLTIEQVGADDYVLSAPNGLGLLINPRPEESHLEYSIARLSFRKIKGNAQKILNKIEDIQSKQLSLVQQYRNKIKNFHVSNLRSI